jgi:hypothetical protein
MGWYVLLPNGFGQLILTPESEVPPLNWFDEDGIIHKGSSELSSSGNENNNPYWLLTKNLLESRERILEDRKRTVNISPLSRDEIIDAISVKAVDLGRDRIQVGHDCSYKTVDKAMLGKIERMYQDSQQADLEAQKKAHDDYEDLCRIERARFYLPLHLATVIEYQYFPLAAPYKVQAALRLSACAYKRILHLAISRLSNGLKEAL